MVNKIKIVGIKEAKALPANALVINTTSKSTTQWTTGLSPFYLGPIALYGDKVAQRMENAWQYAKVYADMVDAEGNPTKEYWQWAESGWRNPNAVRYPKGKGAKPVYALWDGKKLGYVEARQQIYFPLYRDAVAKTDSFAQLEVLHVERDIVLFDFDGYDHEIQKLSLGQVLLNDKRPMGHAFVLKMMLLYGKDVTPEKVLQQPVVTDLLF